MEDLNKRPVMVRHLTTAKAQEAKDLISRFKSWFALPHVREQIGKSAERTKKFLLEYDHTPTPQGGIGVAEPWVKLEDLPLMSMEATDDEMRIDLRLSGLRLKTFAEGACRMIGILNEADMLPKFANEYNDASTNLAEWFLHERLMRTHLKTEAANADPSIIGSVKLNDLLDLYLYEQGAQQGAIRAKMVQMVSLGLWDADPPSERREWRIRAGPVAIVFHKEVFWPVVKHFEGFICGSEKVTSQLEEK